jgi:hypothetical protein
MLLWVLSDMRLALTHFNFALIVIMTSIVPPFHDDTSSAPVKYEWDNGAALSVGQPIQLQAVPFALSSVGLAPGSLFHTARERNLASASICHVAMNQLKLRSLLQTVQPLDRESLWRSWTTIHCCTPDCIL